MSKARSRTKPKVRGMYCIIPTASNYWSPIDRPSSKQLHSSTYRPEPNPTLTWLFWIFWSQFWQFLMFLTGVFHVGFFDTSLLTTLASVSCTTMRGWVFRFSSKIRFTDFWILEPRENKKNNNKTEKNQKTAKTKELSESSKLVVRVVKCM